MERGIITSPFTLNFLGEGNGFHLGKILNSNDVNYILMYWDRMVVPHNNFIGTKFHLEDELLELGFLERPRFESSGTNPSKDMLRFCNEVQNIKVRKAKESSKIDWVLHEIGNSHEKQVDDNTPFNLRFDLYNALPVPPSTVHAEEILNFKMRRKDELTSLHQLLDEIYKEVITSRDFDFSKTQAFARLDAALSDINRINKEKWEIPVRFNLSANFETDLNTVYQSVLAASATYVTAGSTAAIATASLGLLGYFGSSIKLNFNKRKPLNPDVKRVEYLAKASVENLI